MQQTKAPLTFKITNRDHKLYQELSTSGPLKGISGHKLFILAVAYGYFYQLRTPLKDKTKSYTRWEYIQESQEKILKAMAIKEFKELLVVEDYKLITQLAEEYANGGIHKLKADIHSGEFGTFEKRFESKLREILKKVGQK